MQIGVTIDSNRPTMNVIIDYYIAGAHRLAAATSMPMSKFSLKRYAMDSIPTPPGFILESLYAGGPSLGFEMIEAPPLIATRQVCA